MYIHMYIYIYMYIHTRTRIKYLSKLITCLRLVYVILCYVMSGRRGRGKRSAACCRTPYGEAQCRHPEILVLCMCYHYHYHYCYYYHYYYNMWFSCYD